MSQNLRHLTKAICGMDAVVQRCPPDADIVDLYLGLVGRDPSASGRENLSAFGD